MTKEKKTQHYSVQQMTSLINEKLKQLNEDKKITLLGRVKCYPIPPTPETLEKIEQPPDEKLWYERVQDSLSDIMLPPTPQKCDTHCTDFQKAGVKSGKEDQGHTLYHLLDRPTKDGERNVRYALFDPVSFKSNKEAQDNNEAWSLTETLSFVKKLRETKSPLHSMQHSSQHIDQHSPIDEYLIPYFFYEQAYGLLDFSKQKPTIDRHWLFIRISFNKDIKPVIGVYEPSKEQHKITYQLLKVCKSVFTDWVPGSGVKVLKQEDANVSRDHGARTFQNLFSTMLGTAPRPTDALNLNEQRTTLLRATGQSHLIDCFAPPNTSFGYRHRGKILFLIMTITLCAALATTIMLAPHLTATALFTVGAQLGINVSALTALTLPQFAAVASASLAALITVTTSLIAFAFTLGQLASGKIHAQRQEQRLLTLQQTPAPKIEQPRVSPTAKKTVPKKPSSVPAKAPENKKNQALSNNTDSPQKPCSPMPKKPVKSDRSPAPGSPLPLTAAQLRYFKLPQPQIEVQQPSTATPQETPAIK